MNRLYLHVCFVRFLLQEGASLTAVNCDGDVPADIALDETTESLLQSYTRRHGKFFSVCSWKAFLCAIKVLELFLLHPNGVRHGHVHAAGAISELCDQDFAWHMLHTFCDSLCTE